MTQFFFYLLSAVAIGSGLLMVFSRNTMYSVLYLIVCFFAVAGLYIMLHAQFLAIVHIIVYAGAIMVLFLFVVMLMNLNQTTAFRKSNYLRLAAAVSGGTLLLVLVCALNHTTSPELPSTVDTSVGSVQTLGKVLFNDLLIPFELTSVLFISAMIGVVILTKKEQSHE